MSLITIYKGDSSISVDDSPNGLEIMKRGGWTDKAPKGWEESNAVVVDTIETLKVENAKLIEVAEACSTVNDGLIKGNRKLSKQVKDLTAKVKEASVEQEEDKKGDSD